MSISTLALLAIGYFLGKALSIWLELRSCYDPGVIAEKGDASALFSGEYVVWKSDYRLSMPSNMTASLDKHRMSSLENPA